MPLFKPKNIKKIMVSKNTITTLDTKHKEIIESIHNDKTSILPLLLNERKIIRLKLKNKGLTIDDKLNLHDKLNEIKVKIKMIYTKEKEYLLNNSTYIFDYFEQKKNISDSSIKTKTTVLDNFFKITNKSIPDAVSDTVSDTVTDTVSDTVTDAMTDAMTDASKKSFDNSMNSNIIYEDRIINTDTNINSSTIQTYLTNVDESFLDINNYIVQTDVCKFCNKGEMIAVDYEGIMVCNFCSNSIKYLVENEKPSYKEPPKEVCFYAYKRINHFREILAQFQAKETTQIPDEVIENIIQQIKKERIDLTHMTNKRTKDILKKLGYNKYYEHIPFIKDKLGIKPPIMSSDLETTLCNLFMDIQGPYAKFCPEDRVNFLNYYYTVYKLCELLDQTQFLPFFPMLKDREKRIEQDEIWKNICEELGWEYIPTI